MPQGNTVLQIPIFQNQQSQTDTAVNGLYSTIDAFKQIMIERIDRVENKLKELDNIKIPDNTKQFKKIDSEIEYIKQILSKLDNIKSSIIQITSSNTETIFKDNFDSLVKLLNDSVGEYFKANQELMEKFKIIEHNVSADIDSLKNLITHQIYEPLDYLFIKENFNILTNRIIEVSDIVKDLQKEKEKVKFVNPYVLEVIKYKDLPIPEFCAFGKAIVYNYGIFKRIAFFKNDGKNWIRL
jgi:hypothetical protein